MAKAREESPIPDALCHYPELLLFQNPFFSCWGAEELCSLLKKVVTFVGKATPQLYLHWPGHWRHPCSSFSPHSFFHSPVPDTSPMPSHISKMLFISFADPTSCVSRGSFSLSKHSYHITYSKDSLARLQKGFPYYSKRGEHIATWFSKAPRVLVKKTTSLAYQFNETKKTVGNIGLRPKKMCSVSTNLTDTFCICGTLETTFWRIPTSLQTNHCAGVSCFQGRLCLPQYSYQSSNAGDPDAQHALICCKMALMEKQTWTCPQGTRNEMLHTEMVPPLQSCSRFSNLWLCSFGPA